MIKQNPAPPWLIRVHHRLRSASFALVMLAVALHIHDKPDYGVMTWLFMVSVFLIYPHLLYWLAARSAHSVARELRNLTIDAALLGLTMAWLAFPLWLTVTAGIAALVNSATNTGWPGVGKALAAGAAGMAFGYLLTGGVVEPATAWPVTLVSIMGLAGYLTVVGNVGFVRNSQLRQMRESLRQREAELLSANNRLRDQLAEIEVLQQQLREQAVRDPLTGLHNRRFLDSLLEREAARALRDDEPLALLMVDVDHFKAYNDRYGHPAGDQCLRKVATCLRGAARRGSDLAARYGGEEFVLVLADTDVTIACRHAEVLRLAVAALALEHAGSPLGRVSVSIGVAVMPAVGIGTVEDLLRAADTALYAAKQLGRDRLEVDAASLATADHSSELGLVKLAWHATYESGVPEMDEQHRALFVLANRLLASITAGLDVQTISGHADALLTLAEQHFHDEEALMARCAYPGLAEHAVVHRQLLERGRQLAADCAEGECGAGDMFSYLAQKLVVRHILATDREYAAFIHRSGRPPQPAV